MKTMPNARCRMPNRERSLASTFISRRTVNRGKRHVAQPQIDRQLSTVMDQMVQDEAAQDRGPRHREDFMVAVLQRPLTGHHGVGLRVDLLSSLFDVGIER